MTLIRYPGSKAKLAGPIISEFPEEFAGELFVSPDVHYIEPFFGSGAIGFEIMPKMSRHARITIADIDIGIVSLWRAVRSSPRELCGLIAKYKPNVESFFELKASDGEYTTDADTGFRKLALHRISVSGFGFKAGGPIGGKSQEGAYSVGCRWNAEKMKRVISRLHKVLSRFERLSIEHKCVFDVIDEANASVSGTQTFMYLDPPYYEKGDQLYKHGFSPKDHERLANELKRAKFEWLLSYDDHSEIRRMYSGCNFRQLYVRYSNAVCKEPERPKNHEVLISPATVAA